MIVFKTFARLVKRNLALVFLYAVVFFMVAVFTSAGDGIPTGEAAHTEFDASLEIVILDDDRSTASTHFADYLTRFCRRIDFDGDTDQLREAILTGMIGASVHIEPGFERHLADGERAVSYLLDPRNIDGWRIEQHIRTYLQNAALTIDDEGTVDTAELDALLRPRSDYVYLDTGDGAGDRVLAWYERYYAFAAYILMVVTSVLFIQIMHGFNQPRLKARSAVSGYRTRRYQGEIIAGLVLVTLFLVLLFVGGSLIIGGRPQNTAQLGRLILNFGVYGFVCLSFGYFLVSLSNNRGMLQALANVIPLGMSFVSGVMVDQELVGGPAAIIAKGFPIYYYIRGAEHERYLSTGIAVQLLFALAFALLALTLNRVRRREVIA